MKRLSLKTIDSTNSYALSHFEELDDLCVITANEQTSGRGRFNRTWVSEGFENIYLTFVLKPQKKDFIANLSQYLSVVTAKTLETYGTETQIKWPNDVLINGKKICGILCESFLIQNQIQGVVLGTGINLNMSKEVLKSLGRPATSLNIELNQKIDKEEFLNKLLDEFFLNYEKAIESGFAYFSQDYRKRIHFLGKKISVKQRDGSNTEEYIAKDFDESGNLLVIDKSNNTKTLFSGDLIL